MYYLSVLSIFKNETMTLKTWINHYLWQGAEHFYLIDNGSTDNPLSILQHYIDEGIVSYFYLPERHKQVEHYRFVFDTENLKEKTHWLCVCDIDEFFYGVDKKLTTKLKSLNDFFDYVLCNWQMFGTDGNIFQPEDIRTSITHCKKELWSETKYIFKTQIIHDSSHIDTHSLINIPYIKNNRIRIANQLIKLNHYALQSLEFYTKIKMTRGDASASISDYDRDVKYFYKYDYSDSCDETLKNNVLSPPLDY
jgi:hypothetical protein